MNIIVTIILWIEIASIFLLPPIFLWDIIAFVIYLATPKAKADKRKNAQTGFIISSSVLILNVALLALMFGLIMLLEHL